jgi:phage/plasmid-like protein (TIGR03299 family)
MSRETLNWLNNNTLVGMTDKRGTAWHHRASEQGTEPNHYPGAIPVADVLRRLFNWQAIELPMLINTPKGQTTVPNRKAIVRNDDYTVLGVPSESYTMHQYDEWLIKSVSNLLDDDLVIGSAGLLKNGGVAWVQIEMPENMKVGDVEFRPNLLAATSFNGSLATTYKRTSTVVVCDNTLQAGLGEQGAQFKVRHTANSALRLAEARDALNVIQTIADDFTKEVETLLATKVSDAQFEKFLTLYAPQPADASKFKMTMSGNLRDTLRGLWTNDPRVSPWKNTGFGVLQTVNTYRQHLRPTRKDTVGVERTMMETINGTGAAADAKALRMALVN